MKNTIKTLMLVFAIMAGFSITTAPLNAQAGQRGLLSQESAISPEELIELALDEPQFKLRYEDSPIDVRLQASDPTKCCCKYNVKKLFPRSGQFQKIKRTHCDSSYFSSDGICSKAKNNCPKGSTFDTN